MPLLAGKEDDWIQGKYRLFEYVVRLADNEVIKQDKLCVRTEQLLALVDILRTGATHASHDAQRRHQQRGSKDAAILRRNASFCTSFVFLSLVYG